MKNIIFFIILLLLLSCGKNENVDNSNNSTNLNNLSNDNESIKKINNEKSTEEQIKDMVTIWNNELKNNIFRS